MLTLRKIDKKIIILKQENWMLEENREMYFTRSSKLSIPSSVAVTSNQNYSSCSIRQSLLILFSLLFVSSSHRRTRENFARHSSRQLILTVCKFATQLGFVDAFQRSKRRRRRRYRGWRRERRVKRDDSSFAFPPRHPGIAAKRPFWDTHCSRTARPRIRVLGTDSGTRPPSNECTGDSLKPTESAGTRSRTRARQGPKRDFTSGRRSWQMDSSTFVRSTAGSCPGPPKERSPPFARGIAEHTLRKSH